MSGIYISGVELPKDPFYPIHATIYADGTVVTGHGIGESAKEAIPVPDHGRLGDLDALASRFDNGKQIISSCPFPEEFKAIYSQLADEMKDEIKKCPTIIPADFAKDNNVPDKEES